MAIYAHCDARPDLFYDPTGERLILRSRGEDRALIAYDETRNTQRMRKEVDAVDEMLASTVIGVPGGIPIGNHLLFEKLETDKRGNLVVKRQFVRIVPGNGGRRIFAENWSQHGRFYCWPQNIPSAARATMTINGEAVAEIDYSAHHPRLAYSLAGVRLDCDAYDVGGGFKRRHVKAGLVIAFNAGNRRKAVSALARDQEISQGQAAEIIEAIFNHHRPIARFLREDAGIHLMNLDSKIMMAVTTALTADGIASIPVHDSIIVPTQFGGQAKAKMEESWERFCGKVNRCRFK